jgi:hypothetical protein
MTPKAISPFHDPVADVEMSLDEALTLAQSVLEEQARSLDDPRRKAAQVISRFASPAQQAGRRWGTARLNQPTNQPTNKPTSEPLVLHIETIQAEIGRVLGHSSHAGNLALDLAYEATRLAWAITACPDDQHYVTEKAALVEQATTRLLQALDHQEQAQ